MILWLIVLAPLMFVVVHVAWQDGHRMLAMTRCMFSWLAGRVGAADDVRLISVLVEGPTALVGFRPAAASRQRPDHLLLSPDSDPKATIARLQRWQASGGTVVMWRDRIAGHVELSQLRTGRQVTLSIVSNPVVTISDPHPLP